MRFDCANVVAVYCPFAQLRTFRGDTDYNKHLQRA